VREPPPPSPGEDFDIDHHLPGADDQPMDEWKRMTQVTAATVFLGVTIALAVALLAAFASCSTWRGPTSSTASRSSRSPSRPP
jgi:hypothetical protein